MTIPTHELTVNDLPEEIAVFPLNGALLLPSGRMPLNIFEPRYLAMTEDALAEGRFIGMIQARETGTETVGDTADIYDVGCLGRLGSFAETDDGRYLITLTGLSRFRVVRELPVHNGYRRVRADYADFKDDLNSEPIEGFVRQPFVDALQSYFALHDIQGSWEALEKADEATLIVSVAMACPFSPEEKQAVLECRGLAEQAGLLRSLMEMAVHEQEGPALGVRH